MMEMLKPNEVIVQSQNVPRELPSTAFKLKTQSKTNNSFAAVSLHTRPWYLGCPTTNLALVLFVPHRKSVLDVPVGPYDELLRPQLLHPQPITNTLLHSASKLCQVRIAFPNGSFDGQRHGRKRKVQ